MYRVIYLWQGQRHVHSAWPMGRVAAAQLVTEMRKDGWQAWSERL